MSLARGADSDDPGKSLPVIESCFRNFGATDARPGLRPRPDHAVGADPRGRPRRRRRWLAYRPRRAAQIELLGSAAMSYVELDHPRFTKAELDVFTRRVVADCMTHHVRRCTRRGTTKLDACCQYGCDVDLFERDAILARADRSGPVLRAEVQNLPWFDESEPEHDPDVPSGTVVRTAVHDDGCLFLAHDKRGCAIHRASLEQGWDFRGVEAVDLPAVPAVVRRGSDPRLRRLSRLLVRLRRRCADAVSRRARHDRRPVRPRARRRDGCGRVEGQRAPAADRAVTCAADHVDVDVDVHLHVHDLRGRRRDGVVIRPTRGLLSATGLVDRPTRGQLSATGLVDRPTRGQLSATGFVDRPTRGQLSATGLVDRPMHGRRSATGVCESSHSRPAFRDGFVRLAASFPRVVHSSAGFVIRL